jgi:glycosyltransferase involved in cell wall biosynthesis
MRILFCSPTPIDSRLGASKVYIEAAEGFRRVGWDATVIGPEEFCGSPTGDIFIQSHRLRDYLRLNASAFDVIEYEHNRLPFPRSDFSALPLFVARSVLLSHCVVSTWIPPRPGLKARIGRLVKGWRQHRWWSQVVRQADLTLASADLINVCNTIERDTLVEHGHPADKICLFPFGLFPERLTAFQSDPRVLPDPPVVGFVGTFDPRKGMRDFPTLVDRVSNRYPGVKFRMLGTAGMVPDADGVRSCFPRRMWPRLEIYPRFDMNELPDLLADISVGVFPSAVEGFPFGVLEMLAAGVPVIAYDAPGSPEMLPPEYLVPVRAVGLMAERVCDLLSDTDQFRAARSWARRRATDFCWEEIATRTAAAYTRRLAILRVAVV